MNVPSTALIAGIIMAVVKSMQHSKNPTIADLGEKLFIFVIGAAVVVLILMYLSGV